jgi:hypothetical protein
MIVYGLDFTSSPSATSAKGTSAKWLTLATCRLNGTSLSVETLTRLNADSTNDFYKYSRWLQQKGEWIAGIDFSFGMPLAAIHHFGWLRQSRIHDWSHYIGTMYHHHKDMDSFVRTVEGWHYGNESSEAGNPIKIQPKRITDQISHSQSPLKVNDNPHPGKMFYRGCKSLLEANVIIPPVRYAPSGETLPVVIEAYPRLVAQHFFPEHTSFRSQCESLKAISASLKTPKKERRITHEHTDRLQLLRSTIRESLRYKDTTSDAARDNRKRILDGLSVTNPYSITLNLGRHEGQCVDDSKGDVLDSVLCAVQAAWAYCNKTSNYGIPVLENDLLNSTIRLEGWIVDPTTQRFGRSTPNDTGPTTTPAPRLLPNTP